MSFATHNRGESTHNGGKSTHNGGRSTHNRGERFPSEGRKNPVKSRVLEVFEGLAFSAIRIHENEMRMNSTSADFASAVRFVLHSPQTQKKEVTAV